MITTLLPYSRYIKAGAVLAVVVVLFGAGWKVRDWKADAELSKAKQDHAEAVASAQRENARIEARYRAQEQALQDQITGVSDELTRQLQDTEAQYAAALDTARTDAGRLRIEVARCRAASVPSTPNTTDTASGNDDPAPGRVVPEPDTTLDILRIGRDADRVAARLRACQAYVVQVRAEF